MGYGSMVWPFNQVGVVACPFDDAGGCAVPSFREQSFQDFSEGFLVCLSEVLRGKNPPAQ